MRRRLLTRRGRTSASGTAWSSRRCSTSSAAVKQSVYTQSDLSDLHYAGTERVDDVTYQVLEHRMIGTIAGGAQSPFVQRIFIGPDDLIHRYVLHFQQDGKPGSEVAELENIQAGAPLAASDFAFAPPASATPYDAHAPQPPLPPPGRRPRTSRRRTGRAAA